MASPGGRRRTDRHAGRRRANPAWRNRGVPVEFVQPTVSRPGDAGHPRRPQWPPRPGDRHRYRMERRPTRRSRRESRAGDLTRSGSRSRPRYSARCAASRFLAPRRAHRRHTGPPPDQPYDRVMAPVSATGTPRTWIGQMRPGGVLVAPWGTEFCNGALLRMIVQPDGSARGRFGSKHTFMRLRNQRHHHLDPRATALHTALRSATTRRAQEIHQMVGFSHAAFTIGMLVPDCYPTVEESDTRHRIIELHDVRSRSWARLDLGHDARTFTVTSSDRGDCGTRATPPTSGGSNPEAPHPRTTNCPSHRTAPIPLTCEHLTADSGGRLPPTSPFLATRNSPHFTRCDTQRGRGVGLGFGLSRNRDESSD